MKKKLYKIKIWKKGDCDLLQETDRYLNEDEANNFKVIKQHRGTIEEVKRKNPKESETKKVLGQTIIVEKTT
tara:strand:+ start:334 stop:549 length:216 start_codon:yes stop_codon:yes gene_type:complete